MTLASDEALELARQAARCNALRFSKHAIERMQERIATQADVTEAVRTADIAIPSDDGPNRWVLSGGVDIDGCGLKAVVAIDEDVVTVTVVTVYP